MRILLALDGSPSSLQARDLVAGLPWAPGTTITLLTAFELPVTWFADVAVPGDWLADMEERARDQSRESLAAMAAPLEGHGWTVEQRTAEGRPATEILAAADELDADLIVLGSRGRGPIRTMLLGSVSAEVADRARCPVLVSRADRVSRVLVATDGSDCVGIVPEVLAQWGVLRGLPAVAVSVAPVDSPTYELVVNLYTLGSEPGHHHREELLARYREHADRMVDELSAAGLDAEAEVRSGDAAHEIIAAATAFESDLVVTGSRCLHGVDRWLLGSVARNVLLHAESSVLIVRPRERDAGN